MTSSLSSFFLLCALQPEKTINKEGKEREDLQEMSERKGEEMEIFSKRRLSDEETKCVLRDVERDREEKGLTAKFIVE